MDFMHQNLTELVEPINWFFNGNFFELKVFRHANQLIAKIWICTKKVTKFIKLKVVVDAS